MATPLKTPVRRKVIVITDSRRKARPADSVTVTLYPNSTIGFRANRCRTEYVLPLAAAYMLAVKAEALAQRKAKAEKRKET